MVGTNWPTEPSAQFAQMAFSASGSATRTLIIFAHQAGAAALGKGIRRDAAFSPKGVVNNYTLWRPSLADSSWGYHGRPGSASTWGSPRFKASKNDGK